MAGVKQTSRRLAKAAPDDLLRCEICDAWRTASYFGVKTDNGNSSRYRQYCPPCNKVRNSLRYKREGKAAFPPLAAVRAVVRGRTSVVAPAAPAYQLDVKIDMGNTQRHAPKAAPRPSTSESFSGPHDLYDILLYDPQDNDRVLRRKIGITATGDSRYAGMCRTFGWSVRPVIPAKTFPTKAAAETAERAYIAEVAKSAADWKLIAKEAFAPIKAV